MMTGKIGRNARPGLIRKIFTGLGFNNTGITAINALKSASIDYKSGYANGHAFGLKHGYSDGYANTPERSHVDMLITREASPAYGSAHKLGYENGYKMGFCTGKNDKKQDQVNPVL